jgi:phosphomevalonate kinase
MFACGRDHFHQAGARYIFKRGLNLRISATIPGKLILLGEYAVLHNAPALVTAIDRFLRISVKPAPGDNCILNLPHFGVEMSFQIHDGKVRLMPEQRTRSAAIKNLLSLLNTVIIAENWTIADSGNVEISIYLSDFFSPDGHMKLGLGSSAALTVGLLVAFRQILDQNYSDKRQLLKDSYELHNHFQGLAGSGIDVAASI